MYAIFKTGGKQYKVIPGQKLDIELVDGEKGSEIKFDHVLLLNNGKETTLGKPEVKGAQIHAKILEHGKNKKIKVFKIKRRKHYKKTQGHRQKFTKIEVKDITFK